MKKFEIKKLFLKIFLLIFFSFEINCQFIFVSNENSDTVTVLSTKDKKIIQTIDTGGRPRDMKLSKDNTKLYVAVSEENHIAVIDIEELKIIDYINTGDDPEIFDISFNGNIIAVSNEDDNQLTLIDIESKKIIKTINDVGV